MATPRVYSSRLFGPTNILVATTYQAMVTVPAGHRYAFRTVLLVNGGAAGSRTVFFIDPVSPTPVHRVLDVAAAQSTIVNLNDLVLFAGETLTALLGTSGGNMWLSGYGYDFLDP